MTFREMMQEEGGNLSWCRPYSFPGGNALAVNEGKVVGMILRGEDLTYREPSDHMDAFAREVNPDYSTYQGWSDLHIALDGDGVRECDCRDCPWFSTCDAMAEEMEEF